MAAAPCSLDLLCWSTLSMLLPSTKGVGVDHGVETVRAPVDEARPRDHDLSDVGRLVAIRRLLRRLAEYLLWELQGGTSLASLGSCLLAGEGVEVTGSALVLLEVYEPALGSFSHGPGEVLGVTLADLPDPEALDV